MSSLLHVCHLHNHCSPVPSKGPEYRLLLRCAWHGGDIFRCIPDTFLAPHRRPRWILWGQSIRDGVVRSAGADRQVDTQTRTKTKSIRWLQNPPTPYAQPRKSFLVAPRRSDGLLISRPASLKFAGIVSRHPTVESTSGSFRLTSTAMSHAPAPCSTPSSHLAYDTSGPAHEHQHEVNSLPKWVHSRPSHANASFLLRSRATVRTATRRRFSARRDIWSDAATCIFIKELLAVVWAERLLKEVPLIRAFSVHAGTEGMYGEYTHRIHVRGAPGDRERVAPEDQRKRVLDLRRQFVDIGAPESSSRTISLRCTW